MVEAPAVVAGDQQQIASVSILLQIVTLGLAFVLGHVLRRHKFYYLHEASASLLIGLIVGGIANISNTEESFKKWFNFKEEFFLLFLLPPIIFYSGFSLHPKPFFSNFGAIITFAIIGTFTSAMVTGVLVYLGGVMFLMYRLPFRESLLFGAIISATDPVTVLAIFQELGADVNLYALVFGESVLNDAVAISLYRTMINIGLHPAANHNIISAVWGFLEVFVGSLTTGVVVALICALLFKYAGLAVNNLHNLECCLVMLFPYFSYMLAESAGLSGIVAILFCGVVMKHYMFPNLSPKSQALTASFFELISSLAETFIFIYMGLAIAIEDQSWSHVGFIFFSILFMLVARMANVFPCAYLVNLIRPLSRQIPMKHQKALWFSGLRGAMAFALALQSTHDLPESHGRTIFTATTAIVVLTVLLIGGSTATMLEALDVIGEGNTSGNIEVLDDESEYVAPAFIGENDGSPTQNLRMRLRDLQRSTVSFTALDKNYLTPFFTARNGEAQPLVDGEASESDPEKRYSSGRSSIPVSRPAESAQQETIINENNNTDGRIRRFPSSNAYGGSHGEQDANKDQPEVSASARGLSVEAKPRQSRNERR